MVWLARRKPVELVRTHTDDGNPPLVRAREQAENLAFATGSLLLAVGAFPVFVLTLVAVVRGRSARTRFSDRVLRTYAST